MDTRTALDREAQRFELPPDAFERLLRRRDRKERNRRVSAAVLAIVLTILSIAGMMRAFRSSGRPATEPTPAPVDTGIFSGMGGWIAYGNAIGIWAVDPERPGHPEAQIRLSTFGGLPLAWSGDGSKLLTLIRNHTQHALAVLNADGTKTLLVEVGVHDWLSGGSFSPDGSKVVYASGPLTTAPPTGSTWSTRPAAHRGDCSPPFYASEKVNARGSLRRRSPPMGLRSHTSMACTITATASG